MFVQASPSAGKSRAMEYDPETALTRLHRHRAADLGGGSGGGSFVIGQLGQSLDGRIATPTGASKYINGHEALCHLHRIRAEVDAGAQIVRWPTRMTETFAEALRAEPPAQEGLQPHFTPPAGAPASIAWPACASCPEPAPMQSTTHAAPTAARSNLMFLIVSPFQPGFYATIALRHHLGGTASRRCLHRHPEAQPKDLLHQHPHYLDLTLLPLQQPVPHIYLYPLQFPLGNTHTLAL